MRRNIIMYFVRVLVCEFTNLYEVYNLLTPVGFPRSRYIKNVITIPRNARFGNIIKKVSGCFFRCLTGPFSLVCQRILYLNTSCRFVLFFCGKMFIPLLYSLCDTKKWRFCFDAAIVQPQFFLRIKPVFRLCQRVLYTFFYRENFNRIAFSCAKYCNFQFA